MIKFLTLFITFSLNSFADDMAFQVNEGLSLVQNSKVLDVGRTRSQDNMGSCFSFTFAKQVEYMCRRDAQCSRELGNDEVSPLHLMSEVDQGIVSTSNGANTDMILEAFNHRPRQSLDLIKESCAPFDQSVHRRYVTENTYYEDESVGVELLESYYQRARNQECHHCNTEMAQEIKSHLTDIEIQIPDLARILSHANTMSQKEFVEKVLIQNHCHADTNKVTTPPFTYHDLGTAQLTSPELVVATVSQLIDRGALPNLNICSGPLNDQNERTCGDHAIIVNGYRTVCSPSGTNCKKELKVQNSWGQGWQNSFNDGWVDAMTLARLAINSPNANGSLRPTRIGGAHVSNVLTWLEPTRRPSVRPTPETRPSPTPREVPPITRVEPRPERTPTPAAPANFNFQAGSIYKCTKAGAPLTFESTRAGLMRLMSNGFSCTVHNL